MAVQPDIITYKDFNDYYADVNTPIRSQHDEFHVFRLCDLGDEIVPGMGPFSTAYYQFAIGSVVQAKVGFFGPKVREIKEK